MEKILFINEPKKINYTGKELKAEFSLVNIVNKSDLRIEKAVNKHLSRFLGNCGCEISIDFESNDCTDISFNKKQGYKLIINEQGVNISGESAQGAFYGIITLSQILEFCKETIPTLEIEDKPDMDYRGLYFDVSRGRIPTVEKFKWFIDNLVKTKTNSLQLYVEHTFEFSGFEEINKEFGCLTAKEIKEICDYANENFIDCIPSLATFGHMYVILQNEKFKHLCELENYIPQEHIWEERMRHHTIDFANPESFKFICKLIDEFLPCFNSKYFNICGDETFDLAKGRNKGKDSGEAYTEFITKVINYVLSKGITPMMWGDVVLHHPDKISLLPKEIVMLNWSYEAKIGDAPAKTFAENGYRQLMCPGLNEWSRFAECLSISEQNITAMVENGFEYGAEGMLNTCWGDNNHTATIENSFMGIALGASKSWNVSGFNFDDFCTSCSKFIFGTDKNIEPLIKEIEQIKSAWGQIRNSIRLKNGFPYLGEALFVPMETDALSEHRNIIKNAVDELEKTEFFDNFKSRVIIAGKINYLFFELICNFKTDKDYMKTHRELMNVYKNYRENWLADNKLGELNTLDEYMKKIPEMLEA